MADPSTANPLATDIGSIIALITGASGAGKGDWDKIIAAADPWASHRGQYQDQLDAFMKDPSSVLKDPAFQAAQSVGAENISRQAGAAGMSASGNRLADLFKYGQSSALDFEKQRFNELEDLAGVRSGSPPDVAKILQDMFKTNATNTTSGVTGIMDILTRLLAGKGGGLIDLFKGGGVMSNFLDQFHFDPTNNPYTGDFSFAGGGDYYDVPTPDTTFPDLGGDFFGGIGDVLGP